MLRLNVVVQYLRAKYRKVSEKRGTRLIFEYVAAIEPIFDFSGCRDFLEHMIPQIGGFPSNHVLFYFHAFLCQCGYYFLCYNYYIKNTTPLQCENKLRD